MALTPLLNTAVVLEVSTDGTTFVPLLGFQTQSEGDTGSSTTEVTLDGGSFSAAGSPSKTLTIAGLLDIADPGQVILRAAKLAKTTITFRKKYDGTNGYKRLVTVIGETRGNPAATGFQTTSFELGLAAASVIVGTGPLMP